eukprot:scaffold2202_cov394-Pavlova_lutheri.AAC.2
MAGGFVSPVLCLLGCDIDVNAGVLSMAIDGFQRQFVDSPWVVLDVWLPILGCYHLVSSSDTRALPVTSARGCDIVSYVRISNLILRVDRSLPPEHFHSVLLPFLHLLCDPWVRVSQSRKVWVESSRPGREPAM